MLWGVWDSSGALYEVSAGPVPTGTPYPGRFDPITLVFNLAEEQLQFRLAGAATLGVRSAERGWGSWHGTAVLLPRTQGTLFVADNALLFVSGFQGPTPEDSLARRLIREPYVRFFCFIRRGEPQGWWIRGRRLFLGCAATNEYWMVPSSKILIHLLDVDSEVSRVAQSFCVEVPNPKLLDAQVDFDLPEETSSNLRFALMGGIPIVGLLGMGSSMAVAFRFPPGSPGAVASVFVGIAFLMGSLVALPIAFSVIKRRKTREDRAIQHALKAHSQEVFLQRPSALAEELALASARWGIPLDYSIRSVSALTSVERFLIWPGREAWLPTIYRYAAYLGEVFARDERHRIRVDWVQDRSGPMLQFWEAKLVADIVGYSRNRLEVAKPLPDAKDPIQYVQETKLAAELSQSVQPVDLFTGLGIRPDLFRKGPDALVEFLKTLGKPGVEEKITRRFDSFAVRRWNLGGGFELQYIAFLRADGETVLEEPRVFRPVWDTKVVLECAVLDVHELPSAAEALVVGDFGGSPGRPIVLVPLLTDFLQDSPDSLGPGQPLRLAVYAIGTGGEFLPPLTAAATDHSFGSVQPATPGTAIEPRARISGVIEESRTIGFLSESNLVHTFILNVQGLRFPVAIDASQVRGSPAVGNAFIGDVWFQARRVPGAIPQRDIAVA